MTNSQPAPDRSNSAATVLFASMIGTTIEYFDFYIYATAAVLIFPKLFFPASSPTAAILQSLATFAIAFFARPVGSAIFGHFGDRIGRKATLVAALLTMGLSTVTIGLLPTYAAIGTTAPLLLALCRFGQGLGLGGEWGGAVLLATENAPANKRAIWGSAPQLGAPAGFILSGGIFLWLSAHLTNAQFFQFGWRIPFLASALLVGVGMYVRLKLTETPDFRKMLARNERVRVPAWSVCRLHGRLLTLGILASVATFVVFYLMTVFALSWGTTALHYPRQDFLWLELLSMLFFALTIPVSALLADRYGSRLIMILVTAAIALFGLAFPVMLVARHLMTVAAFLSLGMILMGFTYGPLGTFLSELFPTGVRYTGSSLTFNVGGILGASMAPYIATTLATRHGIGAVGDYLSVAALLTLAALLLIRKSDLHNYQ